MFITAIENFVLFSTLLALGGFVTACMARRATLSGWWSPHPFTLARIYAASLIAPPVAAAWLVIAAFLPEWWMGMAAFNVEHPAPMHQLHLLSDLTATLEPKLAYATILFAATAALFAAWSSVRSFIRIGRLVERLEMNAAPPPAEQVLLVERAGARHGLDVGLVMSDYPLSFVWGYRRSKLVLSSGLLRTLTAEELAGVLEHEAAHHKRLDNLVKLFLTVCSYTSMAFPLSRFVLRWRAEQVEMVCDEVAAARTSAPLEIADALVKVRRQTLIPSGYMSRVAAASGFVPDDLPSFQRRVRRLIAFSDAPPAPSRAAALSKRPEGTVLLFSALFAATLVIATTLAPLAVHRVAESLIKIIG